MYDHIINLLNQMPRVNFIIGHIFYLADSGYLIEIIF